MFFIIDFIFMEFDIFSKRSTRSRICWGAEDMIVGNIS